MFEGKKVIVTGGSKGIGKILAKSFFDQGASVLICSRNEAELISVCKEFDQEGHRFFGIVADVSRHEDCQKLIDFAIASFGAIDVLINNAGIIGEANEFKISDASHWEHAILVNLFGTVTCTRLVLPYMEQAGKGKIINFAGAGVGSKKPLPFLSSYYTSKIAIAGFTETLAKELEGKNIQVNCIAPGAINTSITEYILAQGEGKVGKDIYDRTVKQKEEGGDSEEKIFELISFLAGEESKHVSGRLLSSKWDSVTSLKDLEEGGDMFKLRRIDGHLFYGKEK
jgi:3-oxoacyl-[acyl-carrier protein] reductase